MKSFSIAIKSTLAGLVFVSACATANAAVTPKYVIVDLGTKAPTYPNSYGRGLNSAAATTGFLGGTTNQAFLYLPGAGLTGLGTLKTGNAGNSVGFAINNNNLVVGQSDTDGGVAHAFAFDTAMHDLTPSDGTSLAAAVNDQGQIAGFTTISSVQQAFLLDPSQGLQTLSFSGMPSAGYGLRSDGRVVGSAQTPASSGKSVAFVTGSNGANPQTIGTLGGATSTAYAINSGLQVVGASATSGGATHAFLYNSAMHDLGVLTGGTSSVAYAINDAGMVVGQSTVTGGAKHGFEYDSVAASPKMLDLNSLVDDADGFVIVDAEGINNSGDISCSATINGSTHAVLLVPNAITAVVSTPNLLHGGDSLVVSVLLAQPAATSETIYLKTSNPAISVPSSTTVAAGATGASVAATINAVTKKTGVVITATTTNGDQFANTTVQPTIVTSVSFSPQSVNAGSTTTGSIILTANAPSGGTVVALSSNNANVTVPASVTVPAGSINATFAVSCSAAAATAGNATITATVGSGANAVSTLGTVTLGAQAINMIQLSPSTVNGGQGSTVNIALTSPAPSGGAAITFTTTNSTLVKVTNVTIPAGSSTGSTPLTTGTTSAEKNVTVTASYNGANSTALLDVKPTVTITGPGLSLSPNYISCGSSSTGTVTLSLPSPGEYVYLFSSVGGFNFPSYIYIPAGNTSGTFTITSPVVPVSTTTTITASLNSDGSSPLGSAVLTVLPEQPIPVIQPSSICGGQTQTGYLLLSVPSAGEYVYLSSSGAGTSTPAYVYASAGSTIVGFNLATSTEQSAETTTITSSLQSDFSVASFTTTASILPTTLIVSIPSANLSGGQNATAVVSLPCPSIGEYIYLKSDTAGVTVPSYIYVGSGGTTASFGITTSYVEKPVTVTITASLSNTFAAPDFTATVIVNATPLTMGVAPAISPGGVTLTGQVVLHSAASGENVYLKSSNPAAISVPSYFFDSAGTDFNTYNVTTYPVTAPTEVTITGSVTSNFTKPVYTTTVTLLPTVPAYITLSPSSVTAGQSSSGTLTLSAPSTGEYFYFSSSNTSVASVPTYIYIGPGAMSGGFTVNTSGVGTALITASASSAVTEPTASATITTH